MTINVTANQVSVQLNLGIKVAKVGSTVAKNQAVSGKVQFRPYQVRQLELFPVGLESLLPAGHFVFFLMGVVSHLDLSGILKKYEGKTGLGRWPFDPVMMVTLILYCFCRGTHSSRGIAKMVTEHIPCLIITGNERPSHDAIDDFRSLHLEELGGLFSQVLKLADDYGLVSLETVAVDGSKVKAFASKRKAMSYERMCEKMLQLPKSINELKEQLAQLQANSDLKSKKECLQVEKEIDFQEKRLTRIRTHKRALEKRVKERDGGKPEPKSQINFTDPESNIMHISGKTFEQGFNAQIVVDSVAQIIVAQAVVQDNNDKRQLISMLNQAESNMGRAPSKALADNGYFSEENITNKSLKEIDLYIPPARKQQENKKVAVIGRLPKNLNPADRMRRKLSTKAGKAIYKMRKAIVEPAFGQIKESVLNFANFSFRGLKKVKAEWALACTCHNLLKIFNSGRLSALSTA